MTPKFRFRSRLWSVLIVWVAVAWAGTAAPAAVYYVDFLGNDAGPGTSAAPWRTLQHAVDRAQAGDRILIRSGAYAGARIERSGRAGAFIVLEPEPGGAVLLDRPSPAARHGSILEIEGPAGRVRFVRIRGFDISGAERSGIDVRNARKVEILGNRVRESGRAGIFSAFAEQLLIEGNESWSNGEQGVYVTRSGEGVTIQRNVLWDNASSGLHMNGNLRQGGNGVISEVRIDSNILFGNGRLGGSGIHLDGVADGLILNNLLFDELANGITLFKGDGAVCTSRVDVFNNTIVLSKGGQWAFDMPDPGCVGNRLINNILLRGQASGGSIAVASPQPPGFVSHHNVVDGRFSVNRGASVINRAAWRALGYGRKTRVSNEAKVFVDPKDGDFELAVGSVARDAGKKLKEVKRDLKRRRRARPYDVGALETSGPSG